MKKMIDESVVIESLSNAEWNKVSVFTYDSDSNMIIGECLEVTMRGDAFNKYDVIGEIQEGEVKIFEEEDDDDGDYNFSEYVFEEDE